MYVIFLYYISYIFLNNYKILQYYNCKIMYKYNIYNTII